MANLPPIPEESLSEMLTPQQEHNRESILRELAQDWFVLGDHSAQMCAQQLLMVLKLTKEK